MAKLSSYIPDPKFNRFDYLIVLSVACRSAILAHDHIFSFELPAGG